MAAAICNECGARVSTRSKFELDCDQCGADESLVELDAYDDEEPGTLRCAECGFEVDAAPAATGENWEETGRYSVDDDCPVCKEPALEPSGETGGPRRQPEYKLAQAAAAKLRRKYGFVEGQADVLAIAEAEGLTIRRGDFQHEGRLVDGRTIEVPSGELTAAQRFLIAHEIGHAHLQHKLSEKKLEKEANAFAAEMVIPRKELKAAVEEGLTPNQLRARFGASREATTYALMSAGLINKVQIV